MNSKHSLLILSGLLYVLLSGCGPAETTGKVFVDDVAVPVGTLMFTPDIEAGIDGPSILGNVKDGTYLTFERVGVTLGRNDVLLTVSRKWVESGGTDTSDIHDTNDVATISQSFDITEGSFDLKFDFDPQSLDMEIQ